MTRRNDKRNNRRNRQRNNGNDEVSMMLGAIMSKAFEEVFGKKDDGDSSGIHAEGITNKDINNINNGNATLYKLRIPDDGSPVEYPVPDNLTFFFNEEGKLMVCKKQKQEKTPDTKNGDPITYDDICKVLFLKKTTYWNYGNNIEEGFTDYSYNDINNCASKAQAKRLVAFNKLQNIAKYLNEGWKPDFTGSNPCTICKNRAGGYNFLTNGLHQAGAIYFKTEELAKEAIRIMGEDSLNDLFSTDW